MSKSRKSPIGWEPFFNEIISAGNTKLASTFIPKCASVSAPERIEMWVKCGMVMKAAEEAVRIRDIAALEALKTKAERGQASEIERMISQLRPK